MHGGVCVEARSRVKHCKVKAVEVVKGAGIGGGDVIVVEEDMAGRLLGLNRYRIAARVSRLRVEGDWPRQEDEMRVVFEPVGGEYPSVVVEFCPACEETEVVVRIVERRGSEAPG